MYQKKYDFKIVLQHSLFLTDYLSAPLHHPVHISTYVDLPNL